MNIDLGGRTAVVTGGASGIGRAVVRELAASGANVVDKDGDGARKTVAELGEGCTALEVDLTDRAVTQTLGEAVEQELGPVTAAVVFFASDHASFITGQVISVSGGLTMAG